MITAQFTAFKDEFGQCKWYLFPIEMQRMFVIVMANAQQPIILSGFGNVYCLREVFKKVKESFSVVIVFSLF